MAISPPSSPFVSSLIEVVWESPKVGDFGGVGSAIGPKDEYRLVRLRLLSEGKAGAETVRL